MSYTPPNPNGQTNSAGSAPVVIASDQSAVPISVASLPLPSGAATAAKQPALGVAGTPSADVISVQGVAGGTAVPVSGTVSATASGDYTVVGKAASGAAATGNPVLVAGSDGTNTQTLLTDSSGRPIVKAAAGTPATGTITASAQTVQLALTGTEPSVCLTLHGTFAGLGFSTEYSPDSGTSWGPCLAYLQGSNAVTSGAATFTGVTVTAAANGAFTIFVPAGATHVRVRSTAFTSGTANVRLTGDVIARPLTGVVRTVPSTSGGADITTAGSTGVAGDASGVISSLGVFSRDYAYSGSASAGHGGAADTWARRRYPNVFKTVAASASGDTALWTPAAGSKFNLMGGVIVVPSGATSATQEVTITLRDATTSIGIATRVSLLAASPPIGGPGHVFNFDISPVGYRSPTDNQVLNVNLSAALTASAAQVTVWGTEEQ